MVGIPRASILEPLRLEAMELVDPNAKVESTTVVSMCDAISRLVDADALEPMRAQPRETNVLTVKIGAATGCGIPERDLPRLFEPFFTTKPAGQGTGLGLPIVQQLVVELGGEIVVTTKERGGTTFRVLLPPAAVTSPPARRSPAGRADATSR